ncbi:replication-relaxation family protein [Actinoallomurus sp. NBC_01490]|uniref:replication-relaxation family protein n=1 Tax=Actinoallomurus sp. NBC_01490 TaxID=2903557 RepID=UPI002E31FF46|nr:replication-relaxation family protein [Actinoallomurus sp. NBC_01490]
MARHLPVPRDPGRSDDAALALLASRLTDRDRWLIRLLWEHHVFTTPQVAQLAYPTNDRARHGMLRLARLGVIESLRILLPPGQGSAPLHHFLGAAGARVLAAERGIPFAELGYRRDRTLAWAYSSRLNHLIGVNGFFTGLVAASRHDQFSRLDQWWSERRCAETWGGYARPDGYGRWFEDSTHVDFFLEYDTGTEPLAKVVRKLRGYAELAATDGVITPVLIWTSGATREANLRRHLIGAPVPVATTSPHAIRDSRQGPAGPIWLPANHNPTPPRLRLITLARYAHTDRPEGEPR